MDRRIVVVGGGPAGWAAAAACSMNGLPTTLLIDDDAEWPQTYGLWVDELDGLDLGTPFRQTWPHALAFGRRPHRLERAYGRIDNRALRAALRHQFLDTGGTLDVAPRRPVDALPAAVVIDATGAPPGRGPAQIAHGVQVALPPGAVPYPPGSCVLMDWRPAAPGGPPSFLYAQDLGPDGWFLEETVLAGPTDVDPAALARRLQARVPALADALGPDAGCHEVVRIGLGTPTPARPATPVVPFGARAGFVHPGTGYSLAVTLRLAPVLAAALAEAFTRADAGPLAAAHAGWAALWPAARRRARRLERYGRDRLLGMDATAVQDFFDVVFGLGTETSRPYLSGTGTDREVARFMRQVFAAAPAGLRRQLLPARRPR